MKSIAIELEDPFLGRITVISEDDCLVSLDFSAIPGNCSQPRQVECTSGFRGLAGEMLAYLNGQPVTFSFQVDWQRFPPFQGKILQLTAQIPYGKVLTYGGIAALAGSPKASRAAGSALAHNPLPILIPCHRVVGSDGSLHGYSAPGGLAAKARLLELEGHRLSPVRPYQLER